MAEGTKGLWLYLGASFSPLGRYHYLAKHAFMRGTVYHPFLFKDLNDTFIASHGAVWRSEQDTTVDVSDGLAPDGKPLGTTHTVAAKEYGELWAAQLYPVAGERNLTANRDLRHRFFTDLGL